jgi:site-specific recombinase XerD
MEDVQKLTRHSNISTLIDFYSHVSPQKIDKVLDILEKVYVEKK